MKNFYPKQMAPMNEYYIQKHNFRKNVGKGETALKNYVGD